MGAPEELAAPDTLATPEAPVEPGAPVVDLTVVPTLLVNRSQATPTAPADPNAALATATQTATSPSEPTVAVTEGEGYAYQAQSGDTLAAVARRFGVEPEQVTSPEPIPAGGLITPGQRLFIAGPVRAGPFAEPLLPDSEVINSPSSIGFDLAGFVEQAGGYLQTYRQIVNGAQLTGVEVIQRVAGNTSINPRLLLAIIEFRSHWVYTVPAAPNLAFPLGFNLSEYQGLYLELSLAAKLLNMGYYGWRDGSLTRIQFADWSSVRAAPQLNAGSIALQYFFARLDTPAAWKIDVYGPDSLARLYTRMFGDPWARAATVEPLFLPGLSQPPLELPFAPGEDWSLTAGPHVDWNTGTPLGGLDFSPITGERPCAVSARWIHASAPGLVIRAAHSQVLLDLDGDGNEQTGWVLLYFHVAEQQRVVDGTPVNLDDHLGHPSCEGGDATGTHVHLARKYNGEWIGAGEALPFVLSGWTALPGALPYEGKLIKGDQTITAHPDGSFGSVIIR